MFLCLLPAGAFRSQICELNLAILFHHISSACNSTMFDQVKLTTSTKVSSTCDYRRSTLKAKKVVSNSSFNIFQEMKALTLKLLEISCK